MHTVMFAAAGERHLELPYLEGVAGLDEVVGALVGVAAHLGDLVGARPVLLQEAAGGVGADVPCDPEEPRALAAPCGIE